MLLQPSGTVFLLLGLFPQLLNWECDLIGMHYRYCLKTPSLLVFCLQGGSYQVRGLNLPEVEAEPQQAPGSLDGSLPQEV